MMQIAFGVSLLITLEVIVFALISWRSLRRETRKTDRYKLFAARDQMIRAVANEAVSEDDEVFRFLYDEINAVIPNAKPLTLSAVVKALEQSRFLNDETFRKKCRESMEHSHEELRNAANMFFAALIEILIERSTFVRVSFWLTHSSFRFVGTCRRSMSGVLTGVRRALSRVLPLESQAYDQYKRLEDLGHGLA